jgi:hypothetical protein
MGAYMNFGRVGCAWLQGHQHARRAPPGPIATRLVCAVTLPAKAACRVCVHMKVIIGCGPTPVKFFMRLRLQKLVPCVSPQPRVRVLASLK